MGRTPSTRENDLLNISRKQLRLTVDNSRECGRLNSHLDKTGKANDLMCGIWEEEDETSV